ncbi:YjbH domain-containing protein [candidate division KSB1 bacterium]|nr:YjbH domain-containing protein [candidate division KSB1 bacterium]
MKRCRYNGSIVVIGIWLLLAGWIHTFALDADRKLDGISHELKTRGFEGIETRILTDQTVFITYENRIYRNQFFALCVVLAMIEKYDFGEIKNILVCPRIEGFEFCQILVPVTVLHELAAQKINAENFVKRIKYYRPDSRYYQSGSAPEQDIYRKVDMILKPAVGGRFGNFEDAFKWNIGLASELQSYLWKGGMANFELMVPLYDEIGIYTYEVRPQRAWLSQTVRLPFDGKSTLAVGLYTPERWGYAFSADWYLLNRYIMLGMNWEYTGFASYQNKTWSYSQPGKSSHRFWVQGFMPKYNIDVTLHLSQYLYGDHGWGVEINRMFGETTIGFAGVITNVDEIGIISLRVPFFPKKRWKPARFRVYHELYHSWTYKSNSVTPCAGQPLITGIRPGTGYNRNLMERELIPAYIKNNPDILDRAFLYVKKLKGANK